MFNVIIGLLIGIATGAVQFILLLKFVISVTAGKAGLKTLFFALTQFLFPFAILVVCAFLIYDSLMWAGIGIAASLITCGVVKFVFMSKSDKKPKKKSTGSSGNKKKSSKK